MIFFFFLPQKSKCSCCSVLESTSEKYFGGLVEHGVIDEQNEFSINVIAFHFVDVVFPPFQLVLEAHNVPELSAGVNCTFEDLAEMDGLVEGNRITCSSPAEKEVPRIVVDQGVYTHVPNSWSRQCQPFFFPRIGPFGYLQVGVIFKGHTSSSAGKQIESRKCTWTGFG